MRKRTSRCVVLGVCLLAMLAVPAWASMTPMDSADFANKIEGDVWPVPGYDCGGSASSDGSVITYTAGSSTYVETTAAMPQSYTIEWNMKVLSSGPNGVFTMWMSNATNIVDNVWVMVGQDKVKMYRDGAVVDVAATGANDDAYHTFRIAHEANSSVFQLWRDGVQIGTDVPTTNFAAADDMWFFGGWGGLGGQAEVDYYRWTEGAYSPVPEPMTLALFGLGGLLLRKRS